MRLEKTYLTLERSWERFCRQHLGVSRAWADRIIGYLEEFGPTYFMLAQATDITPGEYRRIQGSVHGQALLHAGEEIPIEAENAGRLAVAIGELRRAEKAASDAGNRAGAEAGIDDAAKQAVTKSEDLNRTLDQLERTLTAVVSEAGRVHGLRPDANGAVDANRSAAVRRGGDGRGGSLLRIADDTARRSAMAGCRGVSRCQSMRPTFSDWDCGA
jgi:hypothetical protein